MSCVCSPINLTPAANSPVCPPPVVPVLPHCSVQSAARSSLSVLPCHLHDRRADRQTDRQTDRQAGRQADSQILRTRLLFNFRVPCSCSFYSTFITGGQFTVQTKTKCSVIITRGAVQGGNFKRKEQHWKGIKQPPYPNPEETFSSLDFCIGPDMILPWKPISAT